MRILIIFVLICSLPLSLLCQEEESTGKYEPKTERKSNRKEKRKEFNKHFLLSLAVTSADINSNVRFESPNGLFSTQIDLERHLGLTDKKALASALFIYRITPRSGLFSAYYGLGRDNTVELQNDIIFKGDTIHKGSSVRSYFNTYNFNIGYIFSILTAEKSFLGAYINLYVIDIKTGVESETFNFKKSLEYLAPLPNFGLIAQFSLKDWLSLSGSYGMFFYNSYDFSGTFNDASLMLSFKPTNWAGLNIGYHIFDVTIDVPVETFRSIIDYTFSGPSLGVTFSF